MPSPDVAIYVDLTLLDADPLELVQVARQQYISRLPSATLRIGSQEEVLLQALAMEVAEVVFAANRNPGAALESMLHLFGIDRNVGTPATGVATFTFVDSLGHTVPAGVSLTLPINDRDSIGVVTTEAVTVASGHTSADVPIQAIDILADPSGVPGSTTMNLSDSLIFVERVALASPMAPGNPPEGSTAYLTRASVVLQGLNSSLVTAQQFTVAASMDSRVGRAKTIDLYDPSSGNAPGLDLGHTTVALLGPSGAPLTSLDLADIDDILTAKAIAGLDIHVVNATITTVAVTVNVRKLPGYSDATVQANVTASLQAYLNPLTWEWGNDVIVNEIIARADEAAGVDVVLTVTLPASDIALGVTGLAQAGTIIVTVTAP